MHSTESTDEQIAFGATGPKTSMDSMYNNDIPLFNRPTFVKLLQVRRVPQNVSQRKDMGINGG